MQQATAQMRLSGSMQSVASSFATGEQVTAWELLRRLFSVHGEYGAGMAAVLAEDPGPSTTLRKPIEAWLGELQTMFDPKVARELHGRLAILGLCRLDPMVRAHLEPKGFLEAVRHEMKEALDTLMVEPDILLAGAISDD